MEEIFRCIGQEPDDDIFRSFKVKSASEPNKFHEVFLPAWDEDDAVCSCTGFAYRGKCSHIEKVKNSICTWNSRNGKAQTDEQRKNGTCPECGGRTIVI